MTDLEYDVSLCITLSVSPRTQLSHRNFAMQSLYTVNETINKTWKETDVSKLCLISPLVHQKFDPADVEKTALFSEVYKDL
jgi:hypothetical protein